MLSNSLRTFREQVTEVRSDQVRFSCTDLPCWFNAMRRQRLSSMAKKMPFKPHSQNQVASSCILTGYSMQEQNSRSIRRIAMNTFRLCILATMIMASVCVANARQQYQECTSAITSNFNGTAIAEGNQIWFTGVLTVKGLGASKVNLFVSEASIAFTANNQNYNIKVPSSSIRLSPTTTHATTSYGPLFPPILGIGWKTDLPLTGLAGKDLMTAVSFAVPAGGLPGALKMSPLLPPFPASQPVLQSTGSGQRRFIPLWIAITTLLGSSPWTTTRLANTKTPTTQALQRTSRVSS
jgi:hypothetical protein